MDTTNVQVTVGNNVYDLSDVKIHPDWKFNKENYDGDVAIVTLFNPIRDVQPICLPHKGDNGIIMPGGVFVRFTTCAMIIWTMRNLKINS